MFLSEDDNTSEIIDRFFHSSNINIFKSGNDYSITNSVILEELALENPITFTGDAFPVLINEDGQKFIILSE